VLVEASGVVGGHILDLIHGRQAVMEVNAR
jgi:hypothetical protein